MNKVIIFVLVTFFGLCIYASALAPKDIFNGASIDSVKITDADIPEGFIYGKIPDFAKKVLQSNPWMMNKPAVNKLTKNIYPKGDAAAVSAMHMSILAKKERPFNDDIVCYIIVYNNMSSAKKEIEKISEFSKFNNDRTILIPKGNMAVFMIVDDVNNYKYINALKEKIENRLNSIQ